MEGSTVLRSGALFVDSMLQEDLSLNGDYDLRGNRADRPLLPLTNNLLPIPSAPRYSHPQVELLPWMGLLLFP
jgi:hypothetical protein